MGEIAGVEIATTHAGFYKHERPDLVLFRFAEGTACSGVFTQNKVGSAPVDWCKAALAQTQGEARALVVNAGCANAFTGEAGAQAAQRVADAVSAELGCASDAVMLASTGVIGVTLEYGKVLNRLQELTLALDPGKWGEAARAVMTTDTFPKGAVAEAEIDGVRVRVAGIAKGSGMIAPDMATMLGFVATDANLTPAVLHDLLVHATAETFNAVTVDGDTSTNDTLLLFATGRSGAPQIGDPHDTRLQGFRAALGSVLLSLAQALVRDGEGASKFVKVSGPRRRLGQLGPPDRPHRLREPAGEDCAGRRGRQLGPHRPPRSVEPGSRSRAPPCRCGSAIWSPPSTGRWRRPTTRRR